MLKLPLPTRIGNAAAVLSGPHGDISAAARQAGRPRQTVYDHADKVQQAVEDARSPGPSRGEPLQQNQQLRRENRELWDWLEQASGCPLDKQRRFTTTARAMGLSLARTLVLLVILPPANRRPGRATPGRRANHSARAAGRVPRLLDKACRPLILRLCLEEIFFRRKPVLMAADPRQALVKLWQWRRQARKAEAEGQGRAVAEAGEWLVEVVKTRPGERWEGSYRRVSAVLQGVARASSAAGRVNSVARTHQPRHRDLSQGLLDLKRLYWNCPTFVGGKREKHRPYEPLGLKLPSYDPWVLLQMEAWFKTGAVRVTPRPR
jgi:hypothetical protein